MVVAARNEAGNVPAIFRRAPKLGKWTELIFVEGHSKDNTYEAIEKAIAEHPASALPAAQAERRRQGQTRSATVSRRPTGDILMILDADLTVPPEDLPRFYEALCSGQGDFINGVRLVYPMEKQAMRFANLVGNKFFGLAFSWLLSQSIKDTLCGTKVLVARGLRADRRQPRLLRRLRSVRRLRPAVRRGEAEPEDHRPADPLSRAHLRHDATSSAGGTAGCC